VGEAKRNPPQGLIGGFRSTSPTLHPTACVICTTDEKDAPDGQGQEKDGLATVLFVPVSFVSLYFGAHNKLLTNLDETGIMMLPLGLACVTPSAK
jgi:hypothetical protein